MVRSSWIVGLTVLFLFGCGRSPHPGYKLVGDSVHLKYIVLGEGDRLATDSDSALIRFRVALVGEEPGSFLSTERWYAAADLRRGAMVHVLRRAHEGDSMSVIAPASNWPWAVMANADIDPAPDTTELVTELSLIGIRSRQWYEEAELVQRRSDPQAYERKVIASYLANTAEPWQRWGTSELYYVITGNALDTNRVKRGQQVRLSWSGQRLEDGKVFDETGPGSGSFTWRFGDPDQVIEGIAIAVSLLREGQEGAFIVPADLAFGGKGIEGMLDPWTPVRYTVRLEGVERQR